VKEIEDVVHHAGYQSVNPRNESGQEDSRILLLDTLSQSLVHSQRKDLEDVVKERVCIEQRLYTG
jgi:hypothetical protein